MSLKRHIELEAEYSKYIITPLCWLNFIGHPAYWLIWTYLHPQPYDSLMLRCSATIFSLAILLRSYWPQRAKKYFPIVWIVYGAYILPFLFTFIGLKNQFNFVWSLCHMGMIFLLILYTAQTSTMLFSVLIGTIAGIVAFTIDTQPNTLPLLPIEYLPLFIFGIITGLLLNHFSMKGVSEYEGKLISERQKSASIKSLAGSIAHEMRNPLAQIHGSLQLGFYIIQCIFNKVIQHILEHHRIGHYLKVLSPNRYPASMLRLRIGKICDTLQHQISR